MGINVDNVYAGNTMNAAYVKGLNPPVDFEIVEAHVREFGEDGAKEKKVTLSLKGEEKELSLNVTNKNVLREQYGADTDQWIGKLIRLEIIQVNYQGKRVDSIAVYIPKQAAPSTTGGKVLGPIGAEKLTTALQAQSLGLEALRSYLAGLDGVSAQALLDPPAKWPFAWAAAIKKWLEDPAERECDVPF